MRHCTAALLACVASASAHTASATYHRSGRAHLAHGHQISLLAQGEDQQQQQGADSYCISMDGQTMVDDKWCVVSCSNIPPNCPGDLCDCVTGSEAKKRYDTVQETLKNATKIKEEVPAVLGAGGNKGEIANGTAEEAGPVAGMFPLNGDQPVHREQAVHQREPKQGDAGYLEQAAAKRSAAPSPPKSAAEIKWDEQAAAWAVRDSPSPGEEASSLPLQAGNASADNATLEAAPIGDLAEMVKQIAEGVAATEAAKQAAKEASNATQEAPMATPLPESSDVAKRPTADTPKNYTQQTGEVLAEADAAAAEAEIYPLPKDASSTDFQNASTGAKDLSTGFKAEDAVAADAPKSSSQQRAAAAEATVSAEISAEVSAEISGSPPHMVGTASADGDHDDGAGVISPDAGPKPEDHPTATKGWFLSSLPAANAKDDQEKTLLFTTPPEAATETTLFTDLVDAVAKSVVVKAQEKAQEASDKARKTASFKAITDASAKDKEEPAAEPVDPAAGADLANNSTADCPKCAFPANAPDVPNCCSNGGAWEKKCVSVAEADTHTWEDGFNACRSLSIAKLQLANPKKKETAKAAAKPTKGKNQPEAVSQDDKNKNVLADVIGETRKVYTYIDATEGPRPRLAGPRK